MKSIPFSLRSRPILIALAAAAAALAVVAAMVPFLPGQKGADAVTLPDLDPKVVRAAATRAGLNSLQSVIVRDPVQFSTILNSGPAARTALTQLGKALFWDRQVGSDGQSCGSCHFLAGADPRAKNQLSPQLRNTNPAEAARYNATGSGDPGGANYTLVPSDFPFHKLTDPFEENFKRRVETFDTDDAAASQGVFKARFTGTTPGQMEDNGIRLPDPVFNVGGVNVRRVEPRNTPTVINAVFNLQNFWDGRAHERFNGVSPIGPLESLPLVWVSAGGVLQATHFELEQGSLASQAVGPVLSEDEMSFVGRTFPDVGRKMLDGRIPLAYQAVHPEDSVLGPLSRAPANGLNTTYAGLIRAAFHPRYWDSTERVGGYTLMEANFAIFFGVAVQAYEMTLISDQTPFDRFMAGDDRALTQDQMRGLLIFANTRLPFQKTDAAFNGISQGSCAACHGGPETTSATAAEIEVIYTLKLENGRFSVQANRTGLEDEAFANIGVRPIREDLGRGDSVNNNPLSRSRQLLLGLPFGGDDPGAAAAPDRFRTLDNGAFKVPGLRNVELTGPYFHNGGQLTLAQVIAFYARGSDFGDVNIRNMDVNMAFVEITSGDVPFLVKFLQSLTDERVRNEMAPFDRPQLQVPNGHPGDNRGITRFTTVDGVKQADDDLIVLPAVGARGRQAEGLLPLQSFLNVDQMLP